ncbi:MAG: isochorismate synthase MenF [Opitutales bacterium]
MEIIETERHRTPVKDELKLFLGACREAAEEDAHDKVASITLRTRALDPLAVLESIYAREEHHFYLEKRSAGWALAGAEAVVLGAFAGRERMAAAKAWSAEVLAHTIAVGDLDAPFSGPHFYTGIGFEEDAAAGDALPPTLVYLPRWQVARTENGTTAVANFLVQPGADLDALTDRLWGAYEKFTTFGYGESAPPRPSRPERAVEVGRSGDFVGRVGVALAAIRREEVQKVVLARAVDTTFDQPFRPLVTLAGLRERFPSCYAFSFENDRGQSFIGATPERLVRVAGGILETEALAGSAARGDSAWEDARIAETLLASEKDGREHAHVVDSIARRLARLEVNLERAAPPSVLTLPNVHHLRTPLRGTLPAGRHLLDVVEALQPTPAVGGVPRERAVPLIRALEPFRRGLYAGSVGYFDHRGEGEFCVGLRAALVEGTRARLYAGAGIVAGSDPEAEWRETEMKFAALREAIGAAPSERGSSG